MKRLFRIGLAVLIVVLVALPVVPATPVLAATLNIRVVGSTNDTIVYHTGAAWAYTDSGSGLSAGYTSGTNLKQGSGFRFQGITVPQGWQIDAAYITFTASTSYANNTVNSVLIGEDVDDAATFSSLADYQARRGTIVGGANNNYITDASVTWNAIAAWTNDAEYPTPSIITIIQEIVDRVGWISGNDIVIFWDDHANNSTNSADVRRRIYPWDATPAKAALLHIEYSEPVVGNPTTGSATSITATSATLNGVAEDSGGPWDVRFNYGLTTGYGTNTTYEVDQVDSYAFAHNIGSLSPGIIYHFRAQAKDTTETTFEGDDASFLTLPQVPTEFNIQRGDTQATATWTKGDGADKTMVRMKETSFPDAIDDGIQIYFGTDTTVIKTGLSNGITYYFSAWSEITDGDQQYSATYVTDYVTPGTAGMEPPDTLAIESVEVYTDYDSTGDQLYLISYRIIYDETPTEDVGDYFNIDIMEGDTLKARIKAPFWGYRPASIWLSPSSALTWEGNYTIKLVGTEAMWSTPPETTYSLSSTNWKGADFSALDEFVLILANSIEDYESLYTWVEFSPGGGQYLSDYGGRIFRNSISGLAVKRPDLFKTSISEIEIDTVDPEDLDRTYETSLAGNFGTEVMILFGNLGDHIGLDAVATASAFWTIVLVLVIGGITAATGSGMIGVIIALPIMMGGAYLGVVPLALVATLGTFAAIYLLMNLWLART